METTTFEGIARSLGSSITRRRALRGLFAGAAAAVSGAAVLEAEAKRGKRRKKNKRPNQNQNQNRTLPPGAFCESDAQCDASRGYICAVAVNAGNSDRTCSGATGAVCGLPNADGDDTASFCAAGFDCVAGICQRVPDDI